MVVVDGELTPVQQRNLQQIFGCDVVDRVAVILDIFAQHATSREGMAQVELALHRYRLPRLRGRGITMSQQAGGLGGARRGPGETKLEVDRRKVQERISILEDQIDALRVDRATRRKARRRSGLPTAALVGYTNSGKSSLLNRLTGADVLVEDRLFSTLDATVRRLVLPSGRLLLLSDTVGFVRRLPHELVEAFRSTLEEAVETDLLVHIVDASAPDPDGQIEAVHTTLAQVGGAGHEEVLVVNKIDCRPGAGGGPPAGPAPRGGGGVGGHRRGHRRPAGRPRREHRPGHPRPGIADPPQPGRPGVRPAPGRRGAGHGAPGRRGAPHRPPPLGRGGALPGVHGLSPQPPWRALPCVYI